MYTFLKQFALIVIAVIVCQQLVARMPTLSALLYWGMLTLVGVAFGTWALATSQLEKVTWKNHVASYLVPWGWRLNFGKLWPIPILSWIVWMLIAIATVMVLRRPMTSAQEYKGFGTESVLILISWFLDAAALMYVAGTLVKNFSLESSSGKNLLKLIGILAAMLIVSLLFYVNNAPRWALLVAGGPIALVGGAYGLFLVVILIFGRNSRWN